MIEHYRTTLLAVGLLVQLTGCAAMLERSGDGPDPDRANIGARQIAFDFANALMQIDSLPPESSVLEFPRLDDGQAPVLVAMREFLADAGYGMSPVGASTEPRQVAYQAYDADDGIAIRHEVSVGDIGVQRSYRTTGEHGVEPVTALYVRGADATQIRLLDESLFGIEGGDTMPAPAGTHPPRRVDPSVLLARYPELMSGQPSHVATAGTSAGGLVAFDLDSLSLPQTGNAHELGESNYAATLSGFESVVEHTIVFDGGSDRLDNADVALIDDVLSRFEATTDVIALTGYSIGGTAGAAQNRAMAMSRAQRIKDAFTRAGIAAQRVLIEGYWSAQAVEGTPGSAARVRLQRRPS